MTISVTPSSDLCTPSMISVGGCASVNNSGTQLDIGGTQTLPGSGGATDAVGWTPSAPGVPLPPVPGEVNPRCLPDNAVCVRDFDDPQPAAPPDEAATGLPTVTLADLASFVPAAPALSAEPAATGIVGMPTNFVASAGEQVVEGALFGLPVSVRFTPVAYVFDYGDGSNGRSTTGGAAWDALGQAQFTATATSHAYGERGRYVASVTVEYAPAVDFGGGWMPVAGVVTATAGGYPVDVYEVRTGLVDRTCIENPAGPGC